MDVSLESEWKNASDCISNFKKNFPDVWYVLDTGYLVITSIHVSWLECTGEKPYPSEFYLMLNRIRKYHWSSVFLILQKDIDAGFALLRMMAELTRDIYAIAHKPELIAVWRNREEDFRNYRNNFKFDKSHTPSCMVMDIYKIFSRYGVHGHMSTALHSKIKRPKNEDTFAYFEVEVKGVLDALALWFRTLGPIYAMLIDSINCNEDIEQIEVTKLCFEYFDSLRDVISNIENYEK